MTDKLRQYLADPESYPAVFMYGSDGKGGLWKTRNVPAKYSECWMENLPIEAANPKAFATVEKYVSDIIHYVDEKKVGLFFFSKPTVDNPFGTGTGKAQPLTSKVLTPSGYKLMGDIQVGDSVVDGNGELTEVLGVYPQGKRKVYKIHLQDKTFIEVSEGHLNSVQYYDRHAKEYINEVLTTEELIAKLEESTRFSRPRKYRIPIPVVDVWDEADLPLDPYLLGALIGDGGLSGNSFTFSNSEPDIVNRVGELLAEIGYELRESADNYYRISRIDRKQTSQLDGNDYNLHKIIRDLGLGCLSVDKHIPDVYLNSSIRQRTELLQGLMDTDGYVSKTGVVEYSTSSKQLSEDFTYLARSLGIRVTTTIKKSGYIKNEKYHACNDSYRHYMKVPSSLKFFSSEKHTNSFRGRQNEPIRRIDKVEYAGEAECQCISVASPSYTYITDNFTVTHNTTAAVTILNHYLYERLRLHLRGDKDIVDNPVYFLKSNDLQVAFNAQFRGTAQMQQEASTRYYAIKKRAKTVDLLVVDDIATKASTEAFTEELYELVDHRSTEELVTIYTSNEPLSEVGKLLGDRIASRIEGATVALPFTGKDWRKKTI